VLHVVYFEPPVNSTTIQDLHFTVLSSTLSFHFQDQTDFPGHSRAWKIQEKIQDSQGRVRTLHISQGIKAAGLTPGRCAVRLRLWASCLHTCHCHQILQFDTGHQRAGTLWTWKGNITPGNNSHMLQTLTLVHWKHSQIRQQFWVNRSVRITT